MLPMCQEKNHNLAKGFFFLYFLNIETGRKYTIDFVLGILCGQVCRQSKLILLEKKAGTRNTVYKFISFRKFFFFL